MYEELVKKLRFYQTGTLYYEQAADAIEELQAGEKKFLRNISALEMENENLKRGGRWIPVTEKLPDTMKDKSAYSGWSAEIAPSDDVLCYLGSEKRQTVAWYSHTYKEWTTVDENTVYEYGNVTHWMPLPRPPKEET